MEGWADGANGEAGCGEQGVAGPRTVPVELGTNYLADGWTQTLMPFERFLDTHVVSSSGEQHAADEEPRAPKRARVGEEEQPGRERTQTVSFLGDAKSSLGDAKSSLGDATGYRRRYRGRYKGRYL
jgi:hypothetical protein